MFRMSCRESAIQLLSRRDHSQWELIHKLRLKGFTETDIEQTLTYCHHLGYIDDVRYAQSQIRQHIGKGHGELRIRQELRHKHVSDNDVQLALDENETERRQDQGREVQVELIKMAKENDRLKEKIKELEREVSQNSIEWLFKGVDKKDAQDGEKQKVLKYNIFPVLALMRQINDISYKVLEGYAKENIDDKKYREIADYIKRNNQKNNFELKKMLVELDEIIK